MLTETSSHGLRLLTDWAEQTGVPQSSVERLSHVPDTVSGRHAEAAALQDPAILIHELAARPWHDPAAYPFFRAVLLLDSWHPDPTEIERVERRALAFLTTQWKSHVG